jgi:hypothetical protein
MPVLSGKHLLYAAAVAASLTWLPAARADDAGGRMPVAVDQADSRANPFALPAKKDGTKAASPFALPAADYPVTDIALGRKATLTFKDEKCGQPDGRKIDFISASLRTHF